MEFPHPQENSYFFFSHSSINRSTTIIDEKIVSPLGYMKQNTNIKCIKVNLLKISWGEKWQNNLKAR